MFINFLTLEPRQTIVPLKLFTDKKEGSHPEIVFLDEFPELREKQPELSDTQWLYFSLSHPNDCQGSSYDVEINLNDLPRVAKHIISQQIHLYFKQSAIVSTDKVDNLEVWVKKKQQS